MTEESAWEPIDRPEWPCVDPETGTAIMSHPIALEYTHHGSVQPLTPGDWGDQQPPEE